MFVVVSGCFLVEIRCLGCKYAVWCDIWQVWGGLGWFGMFWGGLGCIHGPYLK